MRSAVVAGVLGAMVAVDARVAQAQAWVPPARQGSVTLAVQTIDNTGHVLTNGDTIPSGRSVDASIYVEAEYAITDRFSVSAGIPYVFAKFKGPPPPYVPLSTGDACGCWQHGFQDFGVTARYNVLQGATSVTPSVSVGLPSRDYRYQGEAVVGRRLRELRLGLDAGVRLDRVSPRLALQGRYSFAWVEEVLALSPNRSNLSLDVSWQLTGRAAVRGTLARQVTHGGLRMGTAPPSPPHGVPWGEATTPALLTEHDRLLRDNAWRGGVGTSYELAHAHVFFSYLEFVGGSDTHAGRAFTAGLSIPFEFTR